MGEMFEGRTVQLEYRERGGEMVLEGETKPNHRP